MKRRVPRLIFVATSMGGADGRNCGSRGSGITWSWGSNVYKSDGKSDRQSRLSYATLDCELIVR
jgi:hypothetical protein